MNSETRKVQLIDTNILKNVIEILEKHKLKYFMIGGTLLGAVRHKGFIPWDDDMDIAMPRKDYEIFLNDHINELNNDLRVENFKTNPNYKYYITRVQDTRFKVHEVRDQDTKDSQTYLSIDIFPIDGVPDNGLMREVYYFRIMFYRAIISLIQKDNIDYARKRKWFEKVIILVGVKIPFKRFFSVNRLFYKIDKLLISQSQDSKFAGTIMGAYRTKEIVPRKLFGEGKLYEFEGLMLRGPEKYNEYLHHMYGNYMKLPSKSDRTNKKHFEIID